MKLSDIDLDTNIITLRQLFKLARGLKSEHGENAEYDRALAELCTDACGLSLEYQQAEVATAIGLTS